MRFVILALVLLIPAGPTFAFPVPPECTDAGQFDLGVGAFEVGSRSAILWTRFAPASARPELLLIEIARTPDFRPPVRHSLAIAFPGRDHTAVRRVRGLRPDQEYFYRFRSFPFILPPACTSRVGRFVTAPRPHQEGALRFVVSGDSNAGFAQRTGTNFYVLSAAAQENPDLFLFFGDTIYSDSGVLPSGEDAITLDEYREVHRITRSDPHLQELLAATGTLTGWDDHEVKNDYDGETVDPDRFANGARSFFEYLPIDTDTNPPYRTHRTVRWGRDVELFLMDGRQFRSAEQFCNLISPDGPEAPDTLFSPYAEDEALLPFVVQNPLFLAVSLQLAQPSDPVCADTILRDPRRTYLGLDQLAWLKDALVSSDAKWKIILSNTPMFTLYSTPYDRWEGYEAERQELLAFIGANLDPTHTLVISTDFHVNWAIQRPELTEVIVGPIGQSTFQLAVEGLAPPELRPLVRPLLEQATDPLVAAANQGATLGFEPDAFSYAVVETLDGGNRLRVTVRGDTTYLEGANDPSRVVDLFTVELP